MTNPPHGSGEHEDPDRHPTRPAPGAERPQHPPATPWQGPTRPYGAPAQTYGQPYQQGSQPYGPPSPQQYAQPQYAQQYAPPPYAQPSPGQPAPAQKSKVGLIAAVTGALLLLIAGVVAAVLALQPTVLDPAAVERDVAAQFEDREGVAIELSCDEEMTVDPGATYECSGTTDDGEDVTLEIRIEDEDSAAYTWTEP